RTDRISNDASVASTRVDTRSFSLSAHVVLREQDLLLGA
ncbi:MAG: hypothetical protein ACI80N_001492, partial [Gammaproteobacteria bacterium]